jgi:hypothetical protein
VIRSIDKDNIIKIPFSDAPSNLASAELLLDSLQNCFQIMRLQLDAEDDPQIIFETLDARGAPLQPSDLIRNFLFLRASRNGEDVDRSMKTTGVTSTRRPIRVMTEKGRSSGKKRSGKDVSKTPGLTCFFITMLGCASVRI